ncbi:S1C family serine protease [Parahaliea mediterranea]|uniref:Trypsin-like peptidase domain-containing protein n=1 Tax=Parahaliea mediterranea TaxID=651086 RepID=A0A939DC73_9GAMM|nr:trypsin-like peptidase domain-containing protein [Parahaliea mediterranea]MBN7795354.1 trypsin-like peptidase domain-containing protein [Parahaliea mediterranea]
MRETLKFIAWPAIAGLFAALLILDRYVLPETRGVEAVAPASVSYAAAVRSASPAVVNIYTARLVPERRRPLLENMFSSRFAPPQEQRQRIEQSLGSGVIMTSEGHILTNNHVISEVDAIQVLLHDGRLAKARVIGTDPATDLAVLKIDLPHLQPVELGDSEDTRVGDVVLAIGNPLGFGNSVTQGIVSALGRWGLQRNTYEDYIQTDAIIHLGNSGGALVDTRGRLVGINTLIYTAGDQGRATSPTGIGISLAIPVNLAVFVMQDLIDYGEVIRGWLGVSVEPVRRIDNGTPIGQALVVAAITEDSPAQRAGVKLGDIITHLDGEPIQDGRQTMHQIAMLRPGDDIDVTVQRDHQTLDLHAIVGTMRQSPSI